MQNNIEKAILMNYIVLKTTNNQLFLESLTQIYQL